MSRSTVSKRIWEETKGGNSNPMVLSTDLLDHFQATRMPTLEKDEES